MSKILIIKIDSCHIGCYFHRGAIHSPPAELGRCLYDPEYKTTHGEGVNRHSHWGRPIYDKDMVNCFPEWCPLPNLPNPNRHVEYKEGKNYE